MMQFALLLYDDEGFSRLPEAEQMAIVDEHRAFSENLSAANAHDGGQPLSESTAAKTLRYGGRVEDGPFADAKEQLGGFYIIRAESIDAAIEWARQCPTAKFGHIEVRPIPDYS